MPNDAPLFGLSLRQPPSNVQAEQALLGALLANNKAYDRVSEFLQPDHFADAIHGRIYEAVARRIEAGQLADAVTLKQQFENAGILDEVGGTAYLAQLLTSMVGIINAGEYGRTIFDCAQRRTLIDIAEQMHNAAYGTDPSRTADQIAAGFAAEIDATLASNATMRLTTLDTAMSAAMGAMEAMRTGSRSLGISTGFRCIDQRLGGLEPGLVYVVGGRPGMGKSSVGHQIAVNAARSGVGVLEFALEMSAAQLGRRTLCTAAGVPIMAMKNGRVTDKDCDRLVAAQNELTGLPLTIDDAGGQTAAQIAGRAKSVKRKHGLGLIMIDHLNLMRAEADDARHGGTWAVGRASNMMLQVAKDCGVPVLLLAQLSRGVEGREDKRPTLSDLRQAGDIEQDAYAVGFVYRPEYYLGGDPERREGETAEKFDTRRNDWFRRKDETAGAAELIWAKVRDGEPGTDPMRFHGPTASFYEPT